jgi:hypothetical protein
LSAAGATLTASVCRDCATPRARLCPLVPENLEDGLIPRICRLLFDRIREAESAAAAAPTPREGSDEPPLSLFTVEVSYMEVYMERVRDLLNPESKGNLRVRVCSRARRSDARSRV